MTIWRKGMKAVCITEHPWGCMITGDAEQGPRNGDVLTVSNTVTAFGDGKLYLTFSDWHEPSVYFMASQFRPAAERKTDISVFQAMLNTTPAKERV